MKQNKLYTWWSFLISKLCKNIDGIKLRKIKIIYRLIFMRILVIAPSKVDYVIVIQDIMIQHYVCG